MQLHPHLYKKLIEYTENKISRAPFTLYFDCICNFTLRFLFLIKFPNLFFNLFHFLFSILFSRYFHIYFILFRKILIFVIFYNNYVPLTKNWKQLYFFFIFIFYFVFQDIFYDLVIYFIIFLWRLFILAMEIDPRLPFLFA